MNSLILTKINSIGELVWEVNLYSSNKSTRIVKSKGNDEFYLILIDNIIYKISPSGNIEFEITNFEGYDLFDLDSCEDGGILLSGRGIYLKTDSNGNTIPESEWE